VAWNSTHPQADLEGIFFTRFGDSISRQTPLSSFRPIRVRVDANGTRPDERQTPARGIKSLQLPCLLAVFSSYTGNSVFRYRILQRSHRARDVFLAEVALRRPGLPRPCRVGFVIAMSPPAPGRLILIDAHGIIFQVFHAIRDRMTSPAGLPTNA